LLSASLLAAQAGRAVWDGVYTEEQARRGEAVSKSKCQACHGERLGGDMGPPLAGADFGANWNGKPVSELFDKIRTTMPQGEEGTLSPNQTADLLAFLFQLNKFPGGPVELAADTSALAQIKIQTSK
jgi:mono/diheme cytochrome c family protein